MTQKQRIFSPHTSVYVNEEIEEVTKSHYSNKILSDLQLSQESLRSIILSLHGEKFGAAPTSQVYGDR